jgi:hypothetical protein
MAGACSAPDGGAGRIDPGSYLRRMRNATIKPLVETFDEAVMEICGARCGCWLSRAHARGAESAGVAGYLGAGDQFDEAMGNFALAHAG